MAQDDSGFRVGDTFQISSWGRLTQQEVARRGIAVVLGMVGAYHANCPVPDHFWCSPPQSPLFALAELYQPSNVQGEGYIGCYFRGADFDRDGVPTIHARPSLKALMQPLDDGRVLVHFGRVADPGSDEPGLGLLDQSTVEYSIVTPRAVPDIPEDDGAGTTFVLHRGDGAWTIAHCLQSGDGPEVTKARVLFKLQVDPEPSPPTKLLLNDSPRDDAETNPGA